MTSLARKLGANPLKRFLNAVTWFLLALGALAMAFPLLWMLTAH